MTKSWRIHQFESWAGPKRTGRVRAALNVPRTFFRTEPQITVASQLQQRGTSSPELCTNCSQFGMNMALAFAPRAFVWIWGWGGDGAEHAQQSQLLCPSVSSSAPSERFGPTFAARRRCRRWRCRPATICCGNRCCAAENCVEHRLYDTRLSLS